MRHIPNRREKILEGYRRAKRHKHHDKQILVKLSEEGRNSIINAGFAIIEHLKGTEYNLVYLPLGVSMEDAIQQLSEFEGVENVELDIIHEEYALPNDKYFRQQTAYLDNIDMLGLWSLFAAYPGTIHNPAIALFENGFYLDHPDIQGQYILPGWDSVTNTPGLSTAYDGAHSVITAGAMCAINNNKIAVAGLAFNSKIYPITTPSMSADIRALSHVAERGIKIVNLSLGYDYISYDPIGFEAWEQACRTAKNNNIVICVAAGNNPPAFNALAWNDYVLGISGTYYSIPGRPGHNIYSSSGYDTGTDFCAPFSGWSTTYPSGSGPVQGTSYSSPLVASMVALIRSVNPDFTWREVVDIMARSCIPHIPPEGREFYGYGIPQFTKAVRMAMDITLARGPVNMERNGKPIRQIKIGVPGGYRTVASLHTVVNGKWVQFWNPTSTIPEPPAPEPLPILADNTWEQIAEAVSSGNIPDTWTIGSEKDIVIGNETVTAQIYGIKHDDLASGGKAGLTFGLKNLMAVARRMEATNTNINGFTGSEMYKWLNNTLFPSLPEELNNAIKIVNKKTSAGNMSTTIRTDEMKLFLFSEVECFGTYANSFSGEGAQYPVFTNNESRIKRLANGTGDVYLWFTRSPSRTAITSFVVTHNNGSATVSNAAITRGVCFGFCI